MSNILTKMVNGVQVPLTEEEILEFNEREAIHQERVALLEASLYKQQRVKEYPKLEEVLVALIEKEGEGRPEAWNELLAIRQAIKAKYPKPTNNE